MAQHYAFHWQNLNKTKLKTSKIDLLKPFLPRHNIFHHLDWVLIPNNTKMENKLRFAFLRLYSFYYCFKHFNFLRRNKKKIRKMPIIPQSAQFNSKRAMQLFWRVCGFWFHLQTSIKTKSWKKLRASLFSGWRVQFQSDWNYTYRMYSKRRWANKNQKNAHNNNKIVVMKPTRKKNS